MKVGLWRQPVTGGTYKSATTKTVLYFQACSAGSMGTGQSKQRSCRGGRTIHTGLRAQAWGQLVSGLESPVLGQLLASAGANGSDTQARGRGAKVRYPDRSGSGCPDAG